MEEYSKEDGEQFREISKSIFTELREMYLKRLMEVNNKELCVEDIGSCVIVNLMAMHLASSCALFMADKKASDEIFVEHVSMLKESFDEALLDTNIQMKKMMVGKVQAN